MSRSPGITDSPWAAAAHSYFSLLGALFPTMCSSDEFIFMPRAPGGFELEIVSEGIIEQAVSHASSALAEINSSKTRSSDPGDQADIAHIERCLRSFLLEFTAVQSWKIDPTLYLRLINLALERVFVSSLASEEMVLSTVKILESVPRLLAAGKRNFREVPDAYRTAALEMGPATVTMIGDMTSVFLHEHGTGQSTFRRVQTKALEQLEAFLRHLAGLDQVCTHLVTGPELLDELLRDSFGCETTAGEIYSWAGDQAAWLEDHLSQTAAEIEPGRSWREIYSSIDFTGGGNQPLEVLYQEAVFRLADFFCPARPDETDSPRNLAIKETPPYLKPVRSNAAYRAPDPALPGNSGVFYIPDNASPSAQTKAGREYLFLAAHETFPGHHLLDYHRLRLTNPVRRYIEAPLFYEGWACYAESLIPEWGMSCEPSHRLVLLKRRLWRVKRLLLEHDIHTGRINLEKAAGRLKAMGFEEHQARLLARRYTFNPGYQSTYAWGLHCLLELKRTATGLKPGMFEKILLREGQIPFRYLAPIIGLYRSQKTGVLTKRAQKRNYSWNDLSITV